MLSSFYRQPWQKSLLSACRNAKVLSQIHALILVSGSLSLPHTSAQLITAYARLSDAATAHSVFEASPRRTVSAWNALIIAYSRRNHPDQVLHLYRRMLSYVRPRPDSSTFTVALKSCAQLSDLATGDEIKNHAFNHGYNQDVFVCSSLVNLYAKCGKMDDAMKVFDEMPRRDLVSWTTMITGYASIGRSVEAIRVYRDMQAEGVEGDDVVMIGLIQACAGTGDAKMGRSVHGRIIRHGLKIGVVVETSLVDMYAKKGLLKLASLVFERMSSKNVVSWSALISGFAQNGLADEALHAVIRMQDYGQQPDLFALVGALLACSQIGFLKLGKSVHGFIARRLEIDRISGTALIDMYSKCGRLSSAQSVFNRIRSRDLISWNAMIASYGVHGRGEESLSLFVEMRGMGLKASHATFSSLLSALSHSGLVEEGRYWFDLMVREFGIEPCEKIYTCMVDLLARAGQVEEAHKLIKSMTMKPGIALWVALLSGCHNHRKLELGEYVAEKAMELNPDDPGIHTLISNIYAAAGKWEKVAYVRKAMKKMGMKKVPGYSLVEVDGELHAFLMEDKHHPQYEYIMKMLDELELEMRKLGYVVEIEFELHDLEDQVKERMMCSHSERLAINLFC